MWNLYNSEISSPNAQHIHQQEAVQLLHFNHELMMQTFHLLHFNVGFWCKLTLHLLQFNLCGFWILMQTLLHLLYFNLGFGCKLSIFSTSIYASDAKLFHLLHFNLCFWCKTLPSPPLQSRLLMQTLCDIMLGGAKFQGTENKENPGQLASEFSTCYHEHGFWHAIFQISVNSTVLNLEKYKKGRKNWTSVKYSQNTI